MKVPLKPLLALLLCVCALRPACAQDLDSLEDALSRPAPFAQSRLAQVSLKVQALATHTDAMWRQLLKQQAVQVHLKPSVPPPVSFERSQHQLEAALRQSPNPADKVVLQNALADLHFAWGTSWMIYLDYNDFIHFKFDDRDIARSHFWQAYHFDQTRRPEQAIVDKKYVLTLTFDYRDPQKANRAIWMQQQVLAYYRKTQNLPALAEAVDMAGYYQMNINRLDEAMRYYKEAEALYQKVPGHFREKAEHWWNIAYMHTLPGEYEEALNACAKALKFSQAAHDIGAQCAIYRNIGWINLSNLERPREALKSFRQGQALYTRYPNDQRVKESARGCATGIGYVQVKLKNYTEALNQFKTLLAQARKEKDQDLEASCLGLIGFVHTEMKHYAEAARYCVMAANRFRNRKGFAYSPGDEGQALSKVGYCYMRLGRFSEALRYSIRALQLNRRAGDISGQKDTLGHLCALYAQYKQSKVAIMYGKQAVNLIQAVRRNIAKLDQPTRQAFLKSNEEIYHTLARLLIEEGRYTEADKVLSMLQQNEFAQFVRRSVRGPQMEMVRTVLTTQEKPVVAAQDRKLDNLAKLSAEQWDLEAIDNRTPQQEARLTEVQRKVKAAQADLEAFFATMPTRFGTQVATLQGDKEQLGATQDLLSDLGGQVAQVSTFVDDKGLDLIVTLPTGKGGTIHLSYSASQAQSGGKPFTAWLNTRIYEFVKTIEAGASADNTEDVNNRATQLNNILSCGGALHTQLRGARITTVMWRLSGILRALPLTALRDKDGFWVEKYQNVLLIERSSDFVLKDKPHDNWKALGLGVTKAWTVKGDQFPALSSVKGELQAVVNDPDNGFRGGALPGRVLEDEGFTEKSFFKSLRGATPTAPVPWQVIHVASHFKVSDDASQSYLLLGDGGALTLSALHERASTNRLFRGVDLVTLSACQTAQGTDSLGTLVVENGAKSVMATLWPVADQETAQLMGTFYSTYSQHSALGKASALQQAQLALLHSGKASARPYFWAPFVLMGNWK